MMAKPPQQAIDGILQMLGTTTVPNSDPWTQGGIGRPNGPGSFEGWLAQIGVTPAMLQDEQLRQQLMQMWMQFRMQGMSQQGQPFQSQPPGSWSGRRR